MLSAEQKQFFTSCVDLLDQEDLNEATRAVPAGNGLCLFADREDRPIILIYGAGLRTIVRRRLAEPVDTDKSRRTLLRPITARLYLRQTYSVFETELAHLQVVKAVFCDTYRNHLPRLSTMLLHLDPDEKLPALRRVDRFAGAGGRYWGPFADRASADRCVEIVQDVCDLCRCPHVLADAPRAQACPYAQMGRCLAVCDGTVSFDTYRQAVQAAVDLLDGDAQQRMGPYQQQMQACAARQEYEQAQRLKERIDLIAKLAAPTYRWVMPLERFRILAFQDGPRVKHGGRRLLAPTITPFVIGPGWVSAVAPFELEQAEPACAALLDHLHLNELQDSQGRRDIDGDLLAFTSRYLYRAQRDKGLFVPAGDHTKPADLVESVVGHFTARHTRPAASGKPKLDSLSISQADPPATDAQEPPADTPA